MHTALPEGRSGIQGGAVTFYTTAVVNSYAKRWTLSNPPADVEFAASFDRIVV